MSRAQYGRERYDNEPQARVDARTGETYYLHVGDGNSRRGARSDSGYVDPFEEFGQREIEYRPEELEGFDRVATRVARERSERGQTRSPPLRERLELEGDSVAIGPFAGFTKKLERLIHPHRAVREIVATLGPKRGDQSSPRIELEPRGCFFQEEREDGEEIYAMMQDPPKHLNPIKEEAFEMDSGSVEAIIQERLRISIKLKPFSYRFYFV